MYATEYRNSGVLLFSEEKPELDLDNVITVSLPDDFIPDLSHIYRIQDGELIAESRKSDDLDEKTIIDYSALLADAIDSI